MVVVLVAVGVGVGFGVCAGAGAGAGIGGCVVTAAADAQLLAQLAQHVQSSVAAARANCVLPLAAR